MHSGGLLQAGARVGEISSSIPTSLSFRDIGVCPALERIMVMGKAALCFVLFKLLLALGEGVTS